MKLRILSVVLLLAAAWCAFGGEALKDAEGRTLVPVARLSATHLFEIKDVRMALCRVTGSKEFAIVATVTFMHNSPSPNDVTVVCDFGPLGLFRQNVLSTVCETVKPKTLTQALFIASNTKWAEQSRNIRFTPNFTFSLGSK